MIQRNANERLISNPDRDRMTGSLAAANNQLDRRPVAVRFRHHTLRSGADADRHAKAGHLVADWDRVATPV
jgi:hypothetical protein